jgi:DNA-binding TFAR19-related protein (PDSD5 family)
MTSNARRQAAYRARHADLELLRVYLTPEASKRLKRLAKGISKTGAVNKLLESA